MFMSQYIPTGPSYPSNRTTPSCLNTNKSPFYNATWTVKRREHETCTSVAIIIYLLIFYPTQGLYQGLLPRSFTQPKVFIKVFYQGLLPNPRSLSRSFTKVFYQGLLPRSFTQPKVFIKVFYPTQGLYQGLLPRYFTKVFYPTQGLLPRSFLPNPRSSTKVFFTQGHIQNFTIIAQ